MRFFLGTLLLVACTSSPPTTSPDADPNHVDADPTMPDADPTASDAGLDAGPTDSSCDPITQKNSADTSDTFCGMPLDGDGKQQAQCAGAAAGGGEPTTFTCSPVRTPPTGSVNNADGHILTPEESFYDSCGPRALPLISTGTDTFTVSCEALCVPGEVYEGNTTALRGVAPLTLDDQGVAAGKECRYWWWIEDTNALPSEWQNGLGFAIDPSAYHYSTGTEELPFPSCADLTQDDLDGDGTADNLQWGCAPKAAS